MYLWRAIDDESEVLEVFLTSKRDKRATRRLLRGDRADILARIEVEATAFAKALNSEDARAALTAFMARSRK